jgi:hypothetical protein
MRNPGDHERLRLKRYDDRNITGDEIIWRWQVENGTKAEDGRRMEHEEEERKESEECLLQHSWRRNFSPQFT